MAGRSYRPLMPIHTPYPDDAQENIQHHIHHGMEHVLVFTRQHCLVLLDSLCFRLSSTSITLFYTRVYKMFKHLVGLHVHFVTSHFQQAR